MLDEYGVERAERIVLDQVKFVNWMLEELRKRNKVLADKLGPSYSKLIGLGTPYEELIYHMRKVKVDFDNYLSILREMMLKEEKRRLNTRWKSRRRDRRFIEEKTEQATKAE